MGNQPARQRKHFLLRLACCVILFFGTEGCLYYPEKWTSEEHLALSKYYMERESFKASLKESQTALKLFPHSLGDQALFQIGLIYAHPKNPDQNFTNSKAAFQKLIHDYPNSNLRTQAQLWTVHLHRIQILEATLNVKKREIDQLQNQIKKNSSEDKKQQQEYIQKIKSQEKEIQDLKRNIESLKEIDLKIEEKKRKAIP